MEKIMLSQILEKICVEDAAEIAAAPIPKLSFRHRRRMNRIFSAHANSLYTPKRYRAGRPRRVIPILTAIFLAVLTVTAGAAMIYGFQQNKHPDYTELLTANAEYCPKTIENVYYLSEIPEGYEFYEKNSSGLSVYTIYVNPNTNRHFVFTQHVKEEYRMHFDNEHYVFEELDINGHYALYLDGNNSENIGGTIVWDNDEYVLEIFGDFTKNELVDLANSVKF